MHLFKTKVRATEDPRRNRPTSGHSLVAREMKNDSRRGSPLLRSWRDPSTPTRASTGGSEIVQRGGWRQRSLLPCAPELLRLRTLVSPLSHGPALSRLRLVAGNLGSDRVEGRIAAI